MSDELHRRDERRLPGDRRHLTAEEMEFLRALLRHGPGGNEKRFKLEDRLVREMNDGGMGGLYFESRNGNSERKLGRSLVEAQFLDRDGVLVSAVVNLDTEGELFELDLWKVDFSRLLEFPKAQDIVMKPKTGQYRA